MVHSWLTYTSRVVDFAKDQTGTITTDYIVITATVMGLGLGGVAAVRTGVGDLSGSVGASLSDTQIAALNLSGQGIDASGGVWSGREFWETAGGRCEPGPNCAPPTLTFEETLRLSKTESLYRVTDVTYPDDPDRTEVTVTWYDNNRQKIETPENVPDNPTYLCQDMNGRSFCDTTPKATKG
jgi:hypothetical protein